MTKSRGLSVALMLSALVLAGVAVNSTSAQGKKASHSVEKATKEAAVKEIAQNDKLRVYEVTYKPGEMTPSAKRPMRVAHALIGGTLERTYDDGKKELVQYKAGETKILSDERAYAARNVGKTDVRLLIVALK
jgi:hypothetical protein